jgi:hypothetical protein
VAFRSWRFFYRYALCKVPCRRTPEWRIKKDRLKHLPHADLAVVKAFVNAATAHERYGILKPYIDSGNANFEALTALHTEAGRIPALDIDMQGMIVRELGRLGEKAEQVVKDAMSLAFESVRGLKKRVDGL